MTPAIPDEAVQAMPERIYAKTHGASTDVISGQRGLIGGWNEHKRDGQTEFVRADLAAPFLQGVKQEPIGYLFQHEETGLTQVVEVQQVEWGFEKNNPRWKKISPVYSAPVSSPSPRAQALEEAAKIAFDVSENGHYYGEASVDSTSSIYQQGAFEVYEALRALSSQPVAAQLPQDVINLVIAAREAWDTWQLPEEEFKRLDTALEAFASRVPYENEPEALPASPGASE